MLNSTLRLLLASLAMPMLAIVMLLPISAAAQEAADERGKYNPVLAIGEQAPSWESLPNATGETLAFEDFSEAQAVVVVFTCNSCPYAVDYEDRIINLHTKYKERGVAVVAINVNTVPADRLEAMRQRAEEKGFEFPYLYDESQQTARDYGATYTPEFFVLDGQRRVVYMGAMDDSSDASKVTKSYVVPAVEAVLAGGQPEVQETVAIGCRIRMKRRRDR